MGRTQVCKKSLGFKSMQTTLFTVVFSHWKLVGLCFKRGNSNKCNSVEKPGHLAGGNQLVIYVIQSGWWSCQSVLQKTYSAGAEFLQLHQHPDHGAMVALSMPYCIFYHPRSFDFTL